MSELLEAWGQAIETFITELRGQCRYSDKCDLYNPEMEECVKTAGTRLDSHNKIGCYRRMEETAQ